MSRITDYVCTPQLKLQLEANLKDFQFKESHDNPPGAVALRAAAVAVTVIQHEKEAAVIVTKRSPRLDAHSGQWAMPGGRVDKGESTREAALRELSEEVCLNLDDSFIIGALDDYVTRSGYVITPVVLWAGVELSDLIANPGEVASIHAFSFTELARTDSPNLETIAESDKLVLSMNYVNDRIYSPTAAILYQFREVALFARNTRVAHFDQPVFAWK